MTCSDGNCMLELRPKTGMHTNGGCSCLRGIPTQQRIEISRTLKAWRRLIIEQEAYIERLRAVLGEIAADDRLGFSLCSDDLIAIAKKGLGYEHA